MATIVEHDKRKHEILQKALDVFTEEGYEDVTFQKISDRCGITRTTLYIYFKNKREIFLFSIKQLTELVEKELKGFIDKKDLSRADALVKLMEVILNKVIENKKLFCILLPYLLSLKKTGVDTGERVRRRVIRLRHLMSILIIDGIKKGEFKNIQIKHANDLLYGLVESAIFRVTLLNNDDIDDIVESAKLAVEGFKL